jgi:hypothetical protein
MGTFRARFTLTGTSGSAFQTAGAGDDAIHFYSQVGAPKTGQIQYEIQGDNVFLDGSPTGINLQSLPAGFQLINLQELTTPAASFPTGIGSCATNLGASSVAEIQIRFGLYGPTNFVANGVTPSTIVLVDDIDFESPIDLLSFLLADLSTVYDGVNVVVASIADVIDIEGEYTTFQYTYTIDPVDGSNVEPNTPDINGEPANNGTLITIESDPLDPDHVLLDELTISVTCGSIIIKTQTETLLEFWIPVDCSGAGDIAIVATGNGVQFSGSVVLATLNILETDGSGIYVITPGKTNDTLYSSERDGTTRDVKIPNPLGKTGFVGG